MGTAIFDCAAAEEVIDPMEQAAQECSSIFEPLTDEDH
jgi:hypothetical protein